jgi:hypothetical protein
MCERETEPFVAGLNEKTAPENTERADPPPHNIIYRGGFGVSKKKIELYTWIILGKQHCSSVEKGCLIFFFI